MPLDRVDFYLNGQLHPNVKSYRLTYDIFHGAAEFECDLDHDDFINFTRQSVRFDWCVNDIPMMTGFVDKVERTYDKGEVKQMVYGRDMCQVLIDNYCLSPKVYDNKNLDFVLKDVWNNSKIKSSIDILEAGGKIKTVNLKPPLKLPELDFPQYTTQATTLLQKLGKVHQITKTRTDHGQTLFDFCSTLCNTVGLYLYNVPGTDTILIHRIWDPENIVSYNPQGIVVNEAPYQITSIAGSRNADNNVLSAKITCDNTSFYKFIRMIGNSESVESLLVAGGFGMVKNLLKTEKVIGDFKDVGDTTQDYTGLSKFQVLHESRTDAKAWLYMRNQVISNAVIQQESDALLMEYTLAGHSPDGHAPYFVNHLASVTDDTLFENSSTQTFLVIKIQLIGSKDGGTITKMELTTTGSEATIAGSQQKTSTFK